MNPLFQLAAVLRTTGRPAVARALMEGVRWTPRDRFPWVISDGDEGTWRVDFAADLGWHARGEDDEIVTMHGVLVSRDDPPDGHHTIRLPSTWWRALRELGDGNASQALRDAILAHLEANGRVV